MAALLKMGEPPPGGVIVEERETNPFLRSDDPVLKRALGMEGVSAVEVFTALRKKKDMFVW
jgi:hydroxyacylglutathione hydrolase